VRKLGVAHVTAPSCSSRCISAASVGRGVLTREQAREFVREAQSRGERVVMTNGCFDILHVGHVTYSRRRSSSAAPARRRQRRRIGAAAQGRRPARERARGPHGRAHGARLGRLGRPIREDTPRI
jgi:hypothetical protein